MASSEENPASTASKPADSNDGKDRSESESTESKKPKKKTLIGLGKLRESLNKASSGRKGKSLRIPKPSSKTPKKTTLGLPKPATRTSDDKRDDAEEDDEQEKVRSTMTLDADDADEVDEDDGPPTDRIEDDDGPSTDQMSADEIPESLGSLSAAAAAAEAEAPAVSSDASGTASATSSLIDDVQLDADEVPDDEMEAEATMLTDSPFEGSDAAAASHNFGSEPAHAPSDDDFGGESTMVTDSPLPETSPTDTPPGASSSDADSAEDFAGDATKVTDSMLGADPLDDEPPADDDFGGDATMVTDSLHGAEPVPEEDFEGEDKTTVSLVGSPAMDDGAKKAVKPKSPPAKTDGRKKRRQTHSTNPNPPTPEQQSSGPMVRPSTPQPTPDRSDEFRAEGTLSEDSEPGEFHSEKTEVFDSPYENEALVPRLSVLHGTTAGQEFLLNKQRNTIGRGKNNTIMISDLAMSRQHFEISKNNDQSYTVIDLQSANGTRLNGTAIEEAELIHGDRIEVGKTELQFVIPGNRPQQRSRNRRIVPKRAPNAPSGNTMIRQVADSGADGDTTDRILTYVIIGAGALSLCLIGAALFLYFNDTASDEPAAQATAAETPQAQVKYLAGVEKVKERDWQAARVVFEELAEEEPGFPGVDAQLERIAREEKALEKLERAQALLAGGDRQEAARLATSISNETAYYEEAQDLVRKTRQHQVAALYQKAQQAVTDEDLDTAEEHIEALLAEVPNHKGALELRDSIEAAREQAEEEEEATRRIASQREAKRSSKNDDWLSGRSGSSDSSNRTGSRRRVNFTKGFTLYKSGKFDTAAAHFRDIASGTSGGLKRRADKAAKNIDQFASAYQRATRAFDAGAWKTAIDALEKAKRADRSVARSGYFSQEVGSKLATAYAHLGLDEVGRGNYASAYQHYSKGKKNGSSSELTSLRRKLSNKARSLYIQAANKRKTDPKGAAGLCRQITSMVAPSNSMHQKAAKMLEELE